MDLPERVKRFYFHGSGKEKIKFSFNAGNSSHAYEKPFEGVIPNLKRRYTETDSSFSREWIERFMNIRACPLCNGARLRLENLAIKIGGRSIYDITTYSIDNALRYFQALKLTEKEGIIRQSSPKRNNQEIRLLKI